MKRKDFVIHVDTVLKRNKTEITDSVQATSGNMPEGWKFCVMVGNIKISNPRCGKPGTIHITTGRVDSLEGGDFKVSELEIAIQDFFDKNF